MRTSLFFAYSLALAVGVLFTIYFLIGYVATLGYPSALGSAFRKGLEISVVLTVIFWTSNRVKDLKRRLGKRIETVGKHSTFASFD